MLNFRNFRYLLALGCLLFSMSSCGVGYGASQASIPHAVYHVVKRGEKLEGIGSRFGVSAGELALLNGLNTVDYVSPGQVLLISYGDTKGGNTRRTGSSSYRNYGRGNNNSQSYRRSGTYSNDNDYGDAFGSGWGREPSDVLASSYKGRLSWPVAGGQIVSGFGRRPGTVHDGLDIKAQSGTPIFAAQSGQVVYADDRIPGYGNLVILRSKDGFTTIYAHCRKLLVKEGDSVTSGQQIAEVGDTGHATGFHLHFEVRVKSKDGKFIAVNPLPYFAQMSP